MSYGLTELKWKDGVLLEMTNMQIMHVAHKLATWINKTKLSDLNLGIGKIIVDQMSFLQYSLLVQVTDLLLNCKDKKDNSEWIDTQYILALAQVCRNNDFDIGAKVIDAYIKFIEYKVIDIQTLNQLKDHELNNQYIYGEIN